jgi:PleD family two-component response regulator
LERDQAAQWSPTSLPLERIQPNPVLFTLTMETSRVSRQILVVEDSTEVCRAIVQVLEMESYTVHQAKHGRAHLKMLEAMTPDLTFPTSICRS